jgi:hypothetical protein
MDQMQRRRREFPDAHPGSVSDLPARRTDRRSFGVHGPHLRRRARRGTCTVPGREACRASISRIDYPERQQNSSLEAGDAIPKDDRTWTARDLQARHGHRRRGHGIGLHRHRRFARGLRSGHPDSSITAAAPASGRQADRTWPEPVPELRCAQRRHEEEGAGRRIWALGDQSLHRADGGARRQGPLRAAPALVSKAERRRLADAARSPAGESRTSKPAQLVLLAIGYRASRAPRPDVDRRTGA